MNRLASISAFSAAIGMALAMQAPAARAQNAMPKIVQDNMMKAQTDHLEKCYGINAVAKNDCAEGAHSCAGQATMARDTKSFVLLPAGVCSKIQGGTTKAM